MPTLDINISIPEEPNKDSKTHKNSGYRRNVDDDPLKRRLFGGFINFWDLGQITDGAGGWMDIDFESVPIPVPGYMQYEEIPTAAVLSLNDVWLSVPIDDWETTFRSLEYEPAERYGLDLYVSPSEIYPVGRNDSRYVTTTRHLIHETTWEQNGLKVPGELSSVFFLSYCAFNLWFIGQSNSTFRFKWTSVPDFSGLDVGEQHINKAAKVFLTPRLMDVTFNATGLSTLDIMAGNYRAYQRGLWLDKNYNTTSIGLLTDPLAETSLLELSDTDKVAITEDYRPHSVEVDSVSGFHGDASAWPIVNSSITAHFGSNSAILPSPSALYRPGQLIAVVKQSGTTYYIWCRNSDGFVQERVYGMTGLY